MQTVDRNTDCVRYHFMTLSHFVISPFLHHCPLLCAGLQKRGRAAAMVEANGPVLALDDCETGAIGDDYRCEGLHP
jgi:hypothetical protein